jgi:catechol 2,3-dioxygenase-like lactoylglutathione lyase family enzyme
MISAVHTIIYSDDSAATRAFFRDVLGFDSVDADDGWLIFRLPPAELGVHPAAGPNAPAGRHELYLMCDDLAAAMAELRRKGAEFTSEPADRGFGIMASLKIPGAGELGVYQPKHRTAYQRQG